MNGTTAPDHSVVAVEGTTAAAGQGLNPVRRRGRRSTPRSGVNVAGWTLMSPALVLLLVMTVVPTIYLVRASLRNDTLLGVGGGFVGLQNYRDVLSDPNEIHALLRTAFFVAVVVVIELIIGMLLAVPLAAQSRSNNVAATLMLLPFAVTPVVSAMIFRELLSPTTGWVDYYMGRVGLGAHFDWLGGSNTAWIAIIGLDVWQWTPFVALILMAGLQSLPQEPSEAAAIDGASTWQSFRFITLPMLMPFVAIAITLRTIQAFKTFDSFAVLTNGGPGTSTEIINLNIYRVALQSFRIGAASALAMVFLILLSLLVPLLLRVAGRDPEESAA
jgi:multiple sugar transport system permease protein